MTIVYYLLPEKINLKVKLILKLQISGVTVHLEICANTDFISDLELGWSSDNGQKGTISRVITAKL